MYLNPADQRSTKENNTAQHSTQKQNYRKRMRACPSILVGDVGFLRRSDTAADKDKLPTRDPMFGGGNMNRATSR